MNAYVDFTEDPKISRDDRFRQRYEICNSYLSATGTHLGKCDSAITVLEQQVSIVHEMGGLQSLVLGLSPLVDGSINTVH